MEFALITIHQQTKKTPTKENEGKCTKIALIIRAQQNTEKKETSDDLR